MILLRIAIPFTLKRSVCSNLRAFWRILSCFAEQGWASAIERKNPPSFSGGGLFAAVIQNGLYEAF
jgi:hypothetical protein